MIENFENELTSRGITYKEVGIYYKKSYMLLISLIFAPLQVFSIVQAFIPFERTNGYYDLTECLTIGIFLAIFIEIVKRLACKMFGGAIEAMAINTLVNVYNNDKEVACVTLDKIKNKIDKKKKEN